MAQLERFRPLAPSVVRRLYDDMRVLLTYHSNALEGNTLSLRETQLVIEHGLTVGGHSLREYLEATNHAAAFARLTELVEARTPITTEVLLDLHQLTMGQLLEVAGRFWTTAVSILWRRWLSSPGTPRHTWAGSSAKGGSRL